MGKSEKKEKKEKKDKVEKKEKVEKKDKSEKEKKEKKDKSEKKKKEKKEKKDKSEKKKEKKEKKDKSEKKKDKKRKQNDSESEEEFIIHKKAKVEEPVKNKQQEVSTGWNDWNKASFDGDDAKKNKFLRLLGAKKDTNTTSSLSQSFTPAKKSKGGLYGGLKSALDEDEKDRIANDLEKQFDHGLQFRKQMQMGRRGGLGFK